MEKHNDIIRICDDGILINEEEIERMVKRKIGERSIIYRLDQRYSLGRENLNALRDYIRYLESKGRRKRVYR
jgi:hypothetical protein